MTPAVSIIIPTFRRPERAVEAARSALAQTCSADFEIVLVDNDPAGSAMAPLRALTDPRVTVVHEPRAGVANARNAGLRVARGEMIAFLDDDEIAPPGWLAELLRVQRRSGADVVFGPVRTKLAEPPRDHREYFEAFFAREAHHAEGAIRTYLRLRLQPGAPRRPAVAPSPSRRAQRDRRRGRPAVPGDGGQRRHVRVGAGRVGVGNAGASRVTLAYTLRRAFAYGQGPATKAWTGPKRDVPAVAFWMAVGAAQTVVYGAAALGSYLAKTRRRAFAYRKFVEGVGKLMWFPFIKPRFYGAARCRRPSRSQPAAILSRTPRRRRRPSRSPPSRGRCRAPRSGAP